MITFNPSLLWPEIVNLHTNKIPTESNHTVQITKFGNFQESVYKRDCYLETNKMFCDNKPSNFYIINSDNKLKKKKFDRLNSRYFIKMLIITYALRFVISLHEMFIKVLRHGNEPEKLS